MGMACESEAASGASTSNGGPAPATTAGPAGGFLNPEETAMILTSLSRCQFGDPRAGSGSAEVTTSQRPGSASGESDGERHSDLEGESDDEEAVQTSSINATASGAGGRVQRVQQINFEGPAGSKLDFTDEAGLSHRFRNESNRVKSMVTKHISIGELRAHFDRPIMDVARDLGICITLMKKICRRNGIRRWPHRQIRSLAKSIASMEAAMLSARGAERDKYREQIRTLRLKRAAVIADPNKDAGTTMGGMSPAPGPAQTPTQVPTVPQAPQVPQVPQVQSLRPHHHVPAPKLKLSPTARAVGRAETSTSASTTPTGSVVKGGRWTGEEHAAFLEGIRLYGKDWRRVAQVVATRSAVQTRTHAQKYLLKFAGRFPFEAVDSSATLPTTTHGRAAATHGRATAVHGRASPTATAMTTPASDDGSSVASWTSDEPQPPPQAPVQLQPQPQLQQSLPAIKPARSEAMALILNDSPALGPGREPLPPPLSSPFMR